MKTAAHISLSGDRPSRWGGITGNITDQTDLNAVLDSFSDELDALNIQLDSLSSQTTQVQTLAQSNELKIGTKADQADLDIANQQVEQNRLAILTKADIQALAQLALLVDTKADQSYVNQQIANLVGSAPEALNTIYELAAEIQNDQSLIDSLNQSVANRIRFDIATQALTEIQKDNARTNIGAEKLGTAQQLVSQITVASIGAATAAQGAKADTALQSADVALVALSGLFSSLGGQNKLFDVVFGAYALGSNTAISVTDTLGQMLGKLQAQINAQKFNWINATSITGFSMYAAASQSAIPLKFAKKDEMLWISGALSVGYLQTGLNLFTLANSAYLVERFIAADLPVNTFKVTVYYQDFSGTTQGTMDAYLYRNASNMTLRLQYQLPSGGVATIVVFNPMPLGRLANP